MRGYQAHMNRKIRGCEDARIPATTHGHEDMRMQGCEDKLTLMNLRI